jgi:hypothetical protein
MKILVTVIGGEQKLASNPGPIIAAFSILMFCRNNKLSGFQRLMTLIAFRGHAEDRACIYKFIIFLHSLLQ